MISRFFYRKSYKAGSKGPPENTFDFRPGELFAGDDGNDKNGYCESNIKIHEDRYEKYGDPDHKNWK